MCYGNETFIQQKHTGKNIVSAKHDYNIAWLKTIVR